MAGMWAPTTDFSPVKPRDCECPEAEDSMEPALCAVPSPSSKQDPVNQESKAAQEDRTRYLLLVLVLSMTGTSGRERRDVSRQTWMEGHREQDQSILVKFVIGTQGLSLMEIDSLNEEQNTNNDILLLPNLQESYTNLTRKVLYSFIHLVEHYTFSYLLKCDDDSFVLLDKFVEELTERDTQRSFYWGFFDGRAHVHNKGKWTEADWFLCDRYLPYALGGGYVLSRDLVQRIATASDGLELYNSEDVSVGVWLSPYKAERRHDVRFNTEFVSRGCRNVHIVSHKQSIEDMRSKYKMLKTKGVQCEKEYQTRLSYEYDWKAPPSKCCERLKGIP